MKFPVFRKCFYQSAVIRFKLWFKSSLAEICQNGLIDVCVYTTHCSC